MVMDVIRNGCNDVRGLEVRGCCKPGAFSVRVLTADEAVETQE